MGYCEEHSIRYVFGCSECRKEAKDEEPYVDTSKYCPHCGCELDPLHLFSSPPSCDCMDSDD